MSLPLEIETKLPEIRLLVEETGAELVEVFYRRAGTRGVLTFLVDKEGGVTLDGCAVINQALGAYFDRLTEGGQQIVALQGSYYLEVNSPGLDRPLKTPQDYRRAIGQQLRVQIRDERGTITAVVGKLVAFGETSIELEHDAEQRTILYTEIFKTTRDIAWKK